MAYKRGNREQVMMLPPTIDEYVGEDDPVRAYDAFVEALNLEQLGIEVEEVKVGNSAYDPNTMLKILIYGYSYGWRSSRKLERALHHNLSFIWLTGGMKPDHKTIAKFRRDNREALKKVLKQCVRLCIDLKLIEGNTLFIDGSKIRANASISHTWTEERCRKVLERTDKRIEDILKECEQADNSESGTHIVLPEELKDKRALKEKVQAIVEKIKKEEKTQLNAVDEDCVKVRGRQGTRKCKTACADAGYANAGNLKKALEEEIEVIVPSQKQALHKPHEDDPFGKDKFLYDKENNQYLCPEGKALKYSHCNEVKGHYLYRIKGPSNCIQCKHYGKCTDNTRGRSIIRLKDEYVKEELEALYSSDKGQVIYKKRKEKVELPFGHIKGNLKAGAFLLRGLKGVNAEMALLSTCFNISRMITIMGMSGIIAALG